MRIRAASVAAVGLVVLAVIGWPALTARLARHIEDRLNRETGRAWRIGDLGFGTGPVLILTDVATGTSEAGLNVARMTVSAPFTLMTGGTGSVQLRAESLSLRVPVDAGLSGHPTLASDMVRALEARVRGLALALSADGRRVTASAGVAEIDLDLAPNAPASTIGLTLEETGQRIQVGLDRPGTEGVRPVRLDITPGPTQTDLPTVRIAATVRAEASLLRAEAISGTLNGSPIAGSARLAFAAKPVLTADLRLGDVNLRAMDDAAPPDGQRALDVPVPTATLPAPSWFAPFDAEVRLAAPRVTIGPARFETVAAVATVREGALEAVITAARAYEGEIKVRYALSRVNENPTGADGPGNRAAETGRHRLSVTLARARLGPLLSDLVGARGLDARATARIDVQATGARPADLPRTATGFADVTLTDGRIDGAPLLGGGDGPFSRFHTLGGGFSIADGRASTNDLQLKSPLIQATGTGALDLVAQTLDFHFQPSVTPQRGRPAAGAALNVPVHVSGPWDNPAVSADMSGLLQNPTGAIEALQDLGTGLFGNRAGGRDGSGGGGFESLLDGIFPKGERAAPPPRRR